MLFADQLYLAPIHSPRNIIDLGTGTGLWAVDMAERFEDARVKGIDLTPISRPVHPNFEFEVDNIEEEWPPGPKYDFVHIRSLFGAIQDWPNLYQECFKSVR